MKKQVQAQLERLREEMEALPKSQGAVRSRLNEVVDEIESELDPDKPNVGERLLDRIRGVVEDFEVEHPKATAILNDISAKLSSMGI